MPYVHVSADDFDDDDLIEELESRGYKVADRNVPEEYEILEKIFNMRRLGQSCDDLIDKYICDKIGRVL
jgi:hypothetical protein